jgi:predicted transcriptional regulator
MHPLNREMAMIVRTKASATTRSRHEASQPSVSDKLVRWLLRYPLQRVEDLSPALAASEKTIYRHLTRLIEATLVEYITPSLGVKTTCRLYYLSQKGIQVAAEQEQVDAHSLAHQWGADEQAVLHLLPRLPSLLSLQDLVNGLVSQAPAMLAHTGGYRADLAWHWQRDYCYTFLDQNYEADAALYFHRKAQPPTKGEDYCALLFIDPDLASHDNARQIRRRLEAALRYRDLPERGYSTRMFPPLIVLARSPRQQEIWQHHATRIATTLHAQPLIGAIAVVPPGQSLENVWTLPWQKLSIAAPCRLRDLFLPIAREALPPGLLQTRTPNSQRPSLAANLNWEEDVLRGDFSRRARAISLVPQSGESERDAIALLSLCLSQRHLDLLHMLYRHPLLTIEELAAFLNLQSETITRYLYELRRYSCIEKYATEQETRWLLSSRGVRFITASCHVPLQDIAEPEQQGDEQSILQRGIVRLKHSLPRTIAIYTFFAALYDDMYENGPEHRLVWWEVGNHCEHRYTYRGNRYTLRPAATFVYRAGQSRLSAWLEWDGIDANEPDLANRLDTYAHFVRAREWTAAGFSTLPMLLIITTRPQQVEQITELVSQHQANTGMLVRLTIATSITEHGPLASIWRQLLPTPDVTHKKRGPIQRALLDLRQNTAT